MSFGVEDNPGVVKKSSGLGTISLLTARTQVNQIKGVSAIGSTGAGVPQHVRSVGAVVSQASEGATVKMTVTFHQDPSDKAFQSSKIYVRGYQGNPAPVHIASASRSPATVVLNNTGENVTLMVQASGNSGDAPLTSAPAIGVKLSASAFAGYGARAATGVQNLDQLDNGNTYLRTPQYQSGLLANGNFEAGPDTPPGSLASILPAGWEVFGTGIVGISGYGNPTVSYDIATPHAGKKSLKITPHASLEGLQSSQRYVVKAGDSYTLSGWFRSDGTSLPYLAVFGVKADGTGYGEIAPPINYPNTSTSWTFATGNVTIPAGDIAYVIVTLRVGNAGTLGSFDDITFDKNSAASTSYTVAQVAHGFSIGTAIYYTGSAWAKARSNANTTLGVGIVSAVADADDFTVLFSGPITGLSGLTAGQYYFVDPTTAGALTTTEPTSTSQFSNPLLLATSTTAGIVLPWRPSAIQNSTTPTVTAVKTTNYSANGGEEVLVDPTSAGFTVTLPAAATVGGAVEITVKNTTTSTNTMTLARTGSDTIDGATSATFSGSYASVTLVSDGASGWWVK